MGTHDFVVRLPARAHERFIFGFVPVDSRTVLRATVVALAESLGGIVVLPELLEQAFQVHLRRIVHDLHSFGVAGAPRAHFFVRGIRTISAVVTGGRGDHSVNTPKNPFRAPETSHSY